MLRNWLRIWQKSSQMKFIPYNQFKRIKFVKERGFSKIYKAIWIDSPCCWNEEKYDFDYNNPNITVALKQLNDSEKLVIMN
ncbi:uncharacterized protein OCT59_021886 [Rhizophagus irregularis]|uniref:uncharacterized protein n=1 Tax=Rhizophagus irregularis TaxID=588596 RepID=UPI00332E5626|nr:hypothetical protein OCT59_021886 [Rhizophagus irregularis]